MTDKLADLIDRLNEFGGQYEGFVISIAALAAVLALLATVLTLFSPLLSAWLRKPKRQDPTFSNPPSAEGSLIRYNARAIELLGRGGAMEKLRAFLLADEPFLWMQIAGVGGQGKSRLGYELILWAQQRDWRAGLLDTPELQGFAPHWPSWQPRQPHLLVLDYVIGREEEIKPVLQSLSKRATALRRPVRLLLLERQRWDWGGLPILDRSGGQSLGPSRGNQGRAEWYLKLTERYDGNDPLLQATRYKDGLLELEHLEQQDLVAIVCRIARLANSSEIALSDDIIAKQLQHIDADGRPLYAYLLGQALADGADPSGGTSGPGWRRDDLLDNRLHRDQGSRWRQQLNQDTPCLGDGSDAERLAVIATIAGGLDCAAAARAGLPIPAHDAATRRRALILTDGPLGTGPSGPSQQIPPLQPDLLGAWFVLRAFDQGLPIADCLDLAWRHGPKQTAAFVLRIAQDFPEQPMSIAILEQDPPEGPAALALAGVAAALIWHLHRARRAFPPAVIKALAAAAADGDGLAMANLGVCYQQGQGVERDLEQAVDWYRKGAEAGDGGAMAYLGVCYQQGQGVERDLEQAVDWYRKGAEAGDGGAMAVLGFCYAQGQGVERDLEQAVDWYRKGAEAGNGGAMASLGFCYAQGQGVERDLEQAVDWYRKGAEAGDGRAMANLGFCYAQGQGVERHLEQAVDWYRKGAEAGNGLAMANLGFCYEQGQGVERDLEQAVDWYRKGAAAGNGRAMGNLGVCYEQGQGVERDLEQAVDWYRKGAEAGDGRAMAVLGFCYEQGQGVERDWEIAFEWYRKGMDLGEEMAAAGLRRLQSVKALLSPASEPKPAIVDWARRHGVEFCSVPWADVAPMPGDWQDLIGADAIAVLVSVGMQLEAEGLDNGLDTLAVQRLRRMPLPFYRDCSLVDIQLQRDGQDMPLLTSALVSSMGAAMLNGTSNLFHAINQDVLTLTDDETTIAYLRFFCAFIRSEDGPFLIVDEPRALPIDHGAERATLAPEVQAAIQPPRALDGTLDSDGWRRFECSLLYGRALFHAILKVAATGMVAMEGDKQIAADLPIRERRYDGIFRTPLLNSPGG
jgi:TPR repeat protein